MSRKTKFFRVQFECVNESAVIAMFENPPLNANVCLASGSLAYIEVNSKTTVDNIQEVVWEHNDGLLCEAEECTGDDVEDAAERGY